MVHAAPKWVNRLQAALSASNVSNVSIAQCPIYASLNLTVDSWRRVGKQILPGLDQPDYVLFTDADNNAGGLLPWKPLACPYPHLRAVAIEADDISSYNAGNTLMYLPVLRQSYNDFIEFSFSDTHGLYHPGKMLFCTLLETCIHHTLLLCITSCEHAVLLH